MVQKDQPIEVHWTNGLLTQSSQHILPVDPTVLDPKCRRRDGHPYYSVDPHRHPHAGGHTEGSATAPHVQRSHADAIDGTPDQWFTSGGQHDFDIAGNTFVYDNDQQAATIWYHDHAMGITRLNVYAGLAGSTSSMTRTRTP